MVEEKPREYREIRKWVKGFHRGSYNLVGFLMASYNKEDGSVRVGWSFCAPNDVFSKKVAENIARGRIEKMTEARIPKRYLDEVEAFVLTCETYYNTDNVFVCCGNTFETDPDYFDFDEEEYPECNCPLCCDDTCLTCTICNDCEEDCNECTKCEGCEEYEKIKAAVGDCDEPEISETGNNELPAVSEVQDGKNS